MRFAFGAPVDIGNDFESIVAGAKDIDTITRSTVPLLAWWRDKAVSQLVPGVDLSDAEARFEYPVTATCAECRSKGKASMTDVMVTLADTAIAVEGKYTESKYEPVDSWRRKGKDRQNRDRVLAHWCHRIEAYTGRKIDQTRLDGLVYQTLHRTASVCAAAPRHGRAEVMYLVFQKVAGSHESYAADLTAAAQILDPDNRIGFTLVEVPTQEGDDFAEIAQLTKAAATADERIELIGEALIARRKIYRFDEPRRTQVRG
jgi:hypothetical protein